MHAENSERNCEQKTKEKKNPDKSYKKSWNVSKNGISGALDDLSFSVCVVSEKGPNVCKPQGLKLSASKGMG